MNKEIENKNSLKNIHNLTFTHHLQHHHHHHHLIRLVKEFNTNSIERQTHT
ncbi:hypothetical protein DOY81_004059 [Sarcophaga bullata]|nr:hypothetical protein DOY81_004059 [Sarcophaga bullata]